MKISELLMLLQGVQITFGDIDLTEYLGCGLGCILRLKSMLLDNELTQPQAKRGISFTE